MRNRSRHGQRGLCGALPILAGLLLGVVHLHAGESGSDLFQAAVKELRAAETDRSRLVPATILLARAAEKLEVEGDSRVEDANACLFWAKRKMNLKEVESFLQRNPKLAERATQVVERKVEPSAAGFWLRKADQLAATGADPLIKAIRYFEVAARFAGTPESLQAQEKSLKWMQEGKGPGPTSAERSPAPDVKQPAGERPTDTRAPVPGPDAVMATEKTVRELFKSEYAKTKPADKADLARKLLQLARESKGEPSERYVLCREAANQGAQAGEIGLALEATQELSRNFAVDVLAAKAETLDEVGKSAKTPEARQALVNAYLDLAAELCQAEKFEAAAPILQKVDEITSVGHDIALAAKVQERNRDFTAQREEWYAVQTAYKKLAQTPNDPKASQTVGQYLCLTKGDWGRGLPMLCRSDDQALGILATKESASPTELEAQVQLGDLWWNWAEKQTGRLRGQAQRRAGYWYERAQPSAMGLAREKLDKRLAELAGLAPAPTPAKPGTRANPQFSGDIWIWCDDRFDLYVNGQYCLSGNDSKKLFTTGLSLVVGSVITIKAINTGGPKGLSAVIKLAGFEPIVTNVIDWKTYDPVDERKWYDLEALKTAKFRQTQNGNSHGSDKFKLGINEKAGTAVDQIWPGPGDTGYLCLFITPELLKVDRRLAELAPPEPAKSEAVASPKKPPEARLFTIDLSKYNWKSITPELWDKLPGIIVAAEATRQTEVPDVKVLPGQKWLLVPHPSDRWGNTKDNPTCSAEGDPASGRRNLPIRNYPRMRLITKVGDDAWKSSWTISGEGPICLMGNDNGIKNNSGSIRVKVIRVE